MSSRPGGVKTVLQIIDSGTKTYHGKFNEQVEASPFKLRESHFGGIIQGAADYLRPVMD